jgi:hypothetical protein
MAWGLGNRTAEGQIMKAMTTFLAAVLSTIAIGVLLIAYGLLAPRVAATSDAAGALNDPRLQYVAVPSNDPRLQYVALPSNDPRLQYVVSPSSGPRAVQAVETYPLPRQTVTSPRPVSYSDRPVRVERAPSRDWIKTAMIIGGSTAAGAGVGGIFGGKKGALIGAAIGGGASTIYEVQKR